MCPRFPAKTAGNTHIILCETPRNSRPVPQQDSTMPELPLRLALVLVLLSAAATAAQQLPYDDLEWVEQAQAWHQQAVRILDHPFSTLAELREFGLQAKKAGVSVVELVGPQKTKRCPGVWCGGLGLCDHINGSFPADDPTATLAEWRQMLKEIHPVRLMWWSNFAYWSTQGEVAEQAMADPTSDVGRFFSYGPNASSFPVCPGKWLGNSSDPTYHSWGYSNPCFRNPKTGKQLCAQGSWGSVAGNCNRTGYSNASVCFNDKLDGCSKANMERSDNGRCIPSLNANVAHQEYVDYLVDSLANSWSRNLGIDGYIVDTSMQVRIYETNIPSLFCFDNFPNQKHRWLTKTGSGQILKQENAKRVVGFARRCRARLESTPSTASLAVPNTSFITTLSGGFERRNRKSSSAERTALAG
jgi:hypothetical protein